MGRGAKHQTVEERKRAHRISQENLRRRKLELNDMIR